MGVFSFQLWNFPILARMCEIDGDYLDFIYQGSFIVTSQFKCSIQAFPPDCLTKLCSIFGRILWKLYTKYPDKLLHKQFVFGVWTLILGVFVRPTYFDMILGPHKFFCLMDPYQPGIEPGPPSLLGQPVNHCMATVYSVTINTTCYLYTTCMYIPCTLDYIYVLSYTK